MVYIATCHPELDSGSYAVLEELVSVTIGIVGYFPAGFLFKIRIIAKDNPFSALSS